MVMDTAREGENEAGNAGADENASLSNAQLFRKLVSLKLKLVAGYALDGFAPFAAVVAIIIAVIALNGNKSDQPQLAQNAATLAAMKAALQASGSELDKLKVAMAQEKAAYDEDRKRQNERMTQVIQSVSKLQAKLKISPTLEEQVQLSISAVVAAPPLAAASPPATPVTAKAAAQAPVTANTGKAPVAATVVTGTDKSSSARMNALKDSIDKFNRK
jgi:hypothetical protein